MYLSKARCCAATPAAATPASAALLPQGPAGCRTLQCHRSPLHPPTALQAQHQQTTPQPQHASPPQQPLHPPKPLQPLHPQTPLQAPAPTDSLAAFSLASALRAAISEARARPCSLTRPTQSSPPSGTPPSGTPLSAPPEPSREASRLCSCGVRLAPPPPPPAELLPSLLLLLLCRLVLPPTRPRRAAGAARRRSCPTPCPSRRGLRWAAARRRGARAPLLAAGAAARRGRHATGRCMLVLLPPLLLGPVKCCAWGGPSKQRGPVPRQESWGCGASCGLTLPPLVAALDALEEQGGRLVGGPNLNFHKVRLVVGAARARGCGRRRPGRGRAGPQVRRAHVRRRGSGQRGGNTLSQAARFCRFPSVQANRQGPAAVHCQGPAPPRRSAPGLGAPSVFCTFFQASSPPSTSSTSFFLSGTDFLICARVHCGL